MLMLTEASSIQSSPAAIQTEEAFGIATSAQLARIAPARKYGRRLPSRVHVWSL